MNELINYVKKKFKMKGQGGGSSNSYDNLAAVATFKNLTK